MEHVRSKAIVLLGSVSLLLYTSEIGIQTTVLILVGVIIGLIGEVSGSLKNRGEPLMTAFASANYTRVCEALYSIFFLCGIIYAPIIVMAPFVVYDAVQIKRRSLLFLVPSVLWNAFAGELAVAIGAAFLALCAAMFAEMSAKSNALEEKIRRLRDTSVEHELLEERKTRELMEEQDANLYMATLKERNRIAREIHDNVGHMLTRSILQVGAIRVINRSAELEEPLSHLQDTLDAAMNSMRKSVHDLHDESIDLKSAIEKLTADLANYRTRLDYDMGKSVPSDVKYAFIAITKEALNNVVRHSSADSVAVTLREHPGFYQLMIADNGTGTGTGTHTGTRRKGIGLKNMQERADAIGGTLKVTAEDGFHILVTVMKQRDDLGIKEAGKQYEDSDC